MSKREEAAREAVAMELVEVKKNLTDLLRKQREVLKERTREASKLRTLYGREHGSSRSTLERLQAASHAEVRATRDVRVTKQKLSELGSESDMERRMRFMLSNWKRERRVMLAEKVRPMDPATWFYLRLEWVNLFEPTPDANVFRCKGCGDTVKQWLREGHWSAHKKEEGDVPARQGKAKAVAAARSSAGGAKTRVGRAYAIPDDVVKRVVSGIESGKNLKVLMDELNGDKVAHPSGAGWNQDRVRRVWMRATGNIGNRQAWKDAVVKYGLKEGKAPRTTRRLAKSSPSSSAKKSAAKTSTRSAAKTGAKKKTGSAASRPANGKTGSAKTRPAGARDLAKDDVTPIPKPVKAEKRATRRK